MKLIDILVERLPALGGWPIDSDDERTLTSSLPGVSWGLNGGGYYAFRGQNDSITYQQYEAARLASSKPEWDGEGLPPVGTVCEYIKKSLTVKEWTECTIDYVGSSFIVYRDCYGVELTAIKCDIEFRPIRSEADKKRDIIISKIEKAYKDCPHSDAVPQEIYEAIAEHIRID